MKEKKNKKLIHKIILALMLTFVFYGFHEVLYTAVPALYVLASDSSGVVIESQSEIASESAIESQSNKSAAILTDKEVTIENAEIISSDDVPSAIKSDVSGILSSVAGGSNEDDKTAFDNSQTAPNRVELSIDTEHVYEGMEITYLDGYIPTVNGNTVLLVIPFLADDALMDHKLTVTVETASDAPFVKTEYEEEVWLETWQFDTQSGSFCLPDTLENSNNILDSQMNSGHGITSQSTADYSFNATGDSEQNTIDAYVFYCSFTLSETCIRGQYPVTVRATGYSETGQKTEMLCRITVILTDEIIQEPESEAENESENKEGNIPSSESEFESETESEKRHDTDFETGTERETESENESDVESEIESESESESEGESDLEPASESEFESEPETAPEREPENNQDTEPASESETELASESASESESNESESESEDDYSYSSGSSYYSSGGSSGSSGTSVRHQPHILLEECSLSGSQLLAGEQKAFTASFINTSEDQSVYSLKITVKTADENVALATTSYYFAQVTPQEVITLENTIAASVAATQKITTLSFTFEYETSEGSMLSDSEELFFDISQETQVSIEDFSLSDYVYSLETVTASLEIRNTGRGPVYNVQVSMEADGLSATNTVYAGNMEAGTSSDGTIKIYVGTLSERNGQEGSQGAAQETGSSTAAMDEDSVYGSTTGTLTLTWEDAYGTVYTSTREFATTIASPQIVELTVEAEDETTSNQWWAVIIVILVLLSLMLLFILLGKLIKRRHQIEDLLAQMERT